LKEPPPLPSTTPFFWEWAAPSTTSHSGAWSRFYKKQSNLPPSSPHYRLSSSAGSSFRPSLQHLYSRSSFMVHTLPMVHNCSFKDKAAPCPSRFMWFSKLSMILCIFYYRLFTITSEIN
jgi:hypothetical protein